MGRCPGYAPWVFLPLGDSPNPVDFRPWVNWGLIAANIAIYMLVSLPLVSEPGDPSLVAAYLRAVAEGLPPGVEPQMLAAQVSAYDLFVFEHGFKPAAPQLSDLFACMFLHGGLLHLGGNMLFLYIYGDNVEHRLGRATYLVVYLGAGIVATLTFAAFASESMVPLVGASGAISGVLGLYFVMFPKNMVKVFIALFPFFFSTVWLKARWVLTAYVVLDNLLPVLAGGSSNVAYGAHLGGFFAGLGIAWLFESQGRGRPSLRRPPRPAAGAEIGPVQQALAMGLAERAAERAAQLSAARLAELPPEDLYSVARGLAAAGRDDLAARALRKALGGPRSASEQAILHLALGELRLAQGQPAAAYQHLLSVLELDRGSEPAKRAEAALRALADRGSLTNRW